MYFVILLQGVNILEDSKRSYAKFIVLCIIMAICWVLLVLYIVFGYVRTSFADIACDVPIVVVFIQDLTAFLGLAYKKNKIRELIYDIGDLWLTDLRGNPDKERVMKKWLGRLALFNRTNIIFVIIGSLFFILFPLAVTIFKQVHGERVFLYPLNMYYLCEHNNILTYALVYLFEIGLCCSVHLCTRVPTVLLLTVLVCDVSTLMRLLQIDMENVFEVGEGDTVSVDEERFKRIVEFHQKLLSVCEKINDCFSVVIFISVLLSSVILGLFGFLTLAIDKTFITSFLVCCFEIFNISWPGQLLADVSLGITDAIYKSSWYYSEVRFRKIVFIIILRAQRPVKLSVLGFSHLTLDMFASVLSSAWSYLSILKRTYS